jgi:hypothetical protein
MQGRRAAVIGGDDLSPRVMAGLDPAIPLRRARCVPKRDHRDKPGDDGSGIVSA